MTISELIQEIESYRVILRTDGYQLYFKPKDALPEEVLDCIRKQKDEIIQHLTKDTHWLSVPEKEVQNSKNSRGGTPELKHSEPVDFHSEIRAVIHEFDELCVSPTQTSPEIRREIHELDEQLTKAVNEGDVVKFWQLLHMWRMVWLKTLH